ncbi:MAG: hypothetical protein U1E67_23365 [Hyphomicrobiales bacterium]
MRRLLTVLATLSLWLLVTAPVQAACNNEQGLRSQKSNKPTTIEFINKSKRTVKVYWIDYKGKRVLYHTLRPGQRAGQDTYRTHPWIIATEAGRCLESAVAGKGKTRLVYAGGGSFAGNSSDDDQSAEDESDDENSGGTTKKPPTQTAAVGLCGNYKQVSSSAGQCPDCTLMIADNPEIQKYFVESSTGWSAEATWVEGDASVAEGPGKWKSGLGHALSGKSFELSMTQQGKSLDIVMDHRGSGIIRAKFRCTD